MQNGWLYLLQNLEQCQRGQAIPFPSLVFYELLTSHRLITANFLFKHFCFIAIIRIEHVLTWHESKSQKNELSFTSQVIQCTNEKCRCFQTSLLQHASAIGVTGTCSVVTLVILSSPSGLSRSFKHIHYQKRYFLLVWRQHHNVKVSSVTVHCCQVAIQTTAEDAEM
jgi:hypothetical protein